MEPRIPIQNIYYLLCYAWNRLEEGEVVDVSGLPSNELVDLFATVLISGVRRLWRTGLNQDYEHHVDELTSIRGRILVAESARRMLLVHGKARCEYDVRTVNTQPNRILKATLRHLAGVPRIDPKLRRQLLSLHRDFNGVADIRLQRLSFRTVQLHSNARFYRFLLSVCELVASSWLVDEQSGSYQFKDFLRDEKRMAMVFESFVFNLIRFERPSLDVRKEKIQWATTRATDTSLGYLPTMETDISVRSSSRTLVIDTKYYREALTTYFDTQRVHSGNLYQVFAYLKNLAARGGQDAVALGMLLYPTVTDSLRLEYDILGHSIQVCTLNLDQDWQLIRQELLDLVDSAMEPTVLDEAEFSTASPQGGLNPSRGPAGANVRQ